MPLGLYIIKELLPQILLIDIDAFIQTYKKNNILNWHWLEKVFFVFRAELLGWFKIFKIQMNFIPNFKSLVH